MKHDSPEQWTPIEQDECVLLLETYPTKQMKNLFVEPGNKPKSGPTPGNPAATGGRQARAGGPSAAQQEGKPQYEKPNPLCSNCQGTHWQQDCSTNSHKHEFCYRCLSYGHFPGTCRIDEKRHYKELTDRMRISSRTEQPMKLKSGQPETSKINKEKNGWRKNGEGELILWTTEEQIERKVNKESAMAEREALMTKIRAEFPDIK